MLKCSEYGLVKVWEAKLPIEYGYYILRRSREDDKAFFSCAMHQGHSQGLFHVSVEFLNLRAIVETNVNI